MQCLGECRLSCQGCLPCPPSLEKWAVVPLCVGCPGMVTVRNGRVQVAQAVGRGGSWAVGRGWEVPYREAATRGACTWGTCWKDRGVHSLHGPRGNKMLESWKWSEQGTAPWWASRQGIWPALLHARAEGPVLRLVFIYLRGGFWNTAKECCNKSS